MIIMLTDEYLKTLKKSIKGKNNYLFLINDSNNELKQHFDPDYKNKFNKDIFLKQLNEKKNYCAANNIQYFFFLVPDKSLVCKQFLPFVPDYEKRNYNMINDFLPDFIDYLDYTCYFLNDSHINYEGGKKLAYHYLKYIDPNFNRHIFRKLVDDQIVSVDLEHKGDLLLEDNWSYSLDEKNDFLNNEVIFSNKYLELLNDCIPENFKQSIRETVYYKNQKSFKDLKVLIFRDSAMLFLKDVLSIYFKEILLYWGYWSFNKDLIEWYKPDIILEIKTERFLENHEFF